MRFDNFGDVGQFIAGMAAAAFVIFWFLRNIRDVGGPKKDAVPVAVQDDATLRLLIMGAVVDIKAFVEEHSHRNRHDARNTITVVGNKLEEKLEKSHENTGDELKELTAKVERLEQFVRRRLTHSNPRIEASEDS